MTEGVDQVVAREGCSLRLQVNFTLMFPSDVLCPLPQLNQYFVDQLTKLRDKEEAIGSMDHNMNKDETPDNFHGKEQFEEMVNSIQQQTSSSGKYKISVAKEGGANAAQN